MSLLVKGSRKEIATGDIVTSWPDQFMDEIVSWVQEPMLMLDELVPMQALDGDEMQIPIEFPLGAEYGWTGADPDNLTDGTQLSQRAQRYETITPIHSARAWRIVSAEEWSVTFWYERKDLIKAKWNPMAQDVLKAKSEYKYRRNRTFVSALYSDNIEVRKYTDANNRRQKTRTLVSYDANAVIFGEDAPRPLDLGHVSEVREYFEEKDVSVDMEQPIWLVSPKGKTSLFGDDKIINWMYHTARPIETGKIPDVEGFRFYVTNALPTVEVGGETLRRNFCFVPRAMMWVSDEEMYQQFDRRTDYKPLWQLYMELSMGAVRTIDYLVVEIRTVEV